MKSSILLLLPVLAALASGCATAPKTAPSATELEGVWNGQELTPGREGPASLTISGQNLTFHGVEENDWIKGAFTIRQDVTPNQLIGAVKECPVPEYVGDKCYAIFKLENGSLTVTGNELGALTFPPAFNTPGMREFVFKREP
jgi:hypothetical protein